ncbi:MAG: OpgC domain-containing protein, partial [Chloroflexota bacterium]
MAVSTFPLQSWPARAWSARAAVQSLERLLLAMRYAGAPIGRDPRLDLLRGFCVFAMVVDHIGGTSWLYALTGGNTGPVTAAEGFVFLSGLVLGMVSRRRVVRDG